MRDLLKYLFGSSGSVGPRQYCLTGIALFAVKYCLDTLIVYFLFHRRWDVWRYWNPFDGPVNWRLLSTEDAAFAGVLMLQALPFIWMGLMLTLRRLRALAWPLWLVVLFFPPFLNLAFFAVLSLYRRELSAPPVEQPPLLVRPAGYRERFVSALIAILVTSLLSLWLVIWTTGVLHQYGFGLFLAVPFCLGMTSALVHSYRQPRSLGDCVTVAMLANLLIGVALLLLRFEGAICLAMAAPLALVLAAVGAGFGYLIQRDTRRPVQTVAALLFALLLAPSVIAAERMAQIEAPLLTVTTSLDIDAPPEVVWRNVVSFAELPPPREWLFRLGIAYPQRARIVGEGVGAVRECVFSTGPFVEPITVWQEPSLLQFSVTSNPAPMEEWTPFRNVRPPHLDGFLVSRRGQFRLIPLSPGRTRLEGTTWYQHHLWPAPYWQLWSDSILHRIHGRVLRHIQQLSETAAASR